jgi:hypothetical protein
VKTKFKIGDRTVLIKAYNTEVERELLMIPMADDEITSDELDQALELLEFPLPYSEYHEFSDELKVAILYKYREMSISENINIKFTCPHCGQILDNTIPIKDILVPPKIVVDYVKDPLRFVKPSDAVDLITNDDLEFSELKKIQENISDYVTTFNFKRDARCLICGKPSKVDLFNPKFCLDNMSEKSLGGLYSMINQMTHYSHYTYSDIMKMYPFERDILMGLLTDTIKKENPKNGNI